MQTITREDLQRCLEVLEAIVEDRTRIIEMPDELRIAVMIAAGRLSRPHRDENRRTAKAFRRVNRGKAQAHDRQVRASTEIRSARLAEVFTPPTQLLESRALAADPAPDQDKEIVHTSEQDSVTTSGHEHAPAAPGDRAPEHATVRPQLTKSRACYVCKTHFVDVHFFYDAMCTPCADLNYRKRFQTANLEGQVAIITGARVKIGFQAATMLLRAGAHVIVTTRFPRDAALRFAKEQDYAKWQHRLEIHGLDLRHSPSVELFASYINNTKSRLDILINNAAQTVRRPPGFYRHLLETEQVPLSQLPASVHPVLARHEECKASLITLSAPSPALPGEWPSKSHDRSSDNESRIQATAHRARADGVVAWHGDDPGVGIRASAALSQLPCTLDDLKPDAAHFPAGRVDADLQQIDLRPINSWRLKLADVPTPELLEVQLVNAIAPFILCSKLKPLMMRDRTDAKHIVNVSAVEGQFARRTKTDKHPHTNMAKAALNMMTLTSAPDYAADGIFMNAVDTGWVTDEDPAELSRRKQERHDFEPPLDIVDGAARICDPIFSGILTGHHVWGKFLKDYAPCAW